MSGSYFRTKSFAVATTQNRGLFIVLLALALFAWTHRHAFSMRGFAEDLSVMEGLWRAKNSGQLFEQLAARFTGPLWGEGGSMWRPLPYATFALDLTLFGRATPIWHVSNLALHVGSAVMIGLLAASWTRVNVAASVAFATFLLYPGSSEVTLWLVGRFDGWVTFAILLSAYGMWRCNGLDRWLALTTAAALLAYMSKETAIFLLPLAFALVSVKAYVNRSRPYGTSALGPTHASPVSWGAALWVIVIHSSLFALYLCVRWLTVGTPSTNVYASSAVANGLDLLQRIVAHGRALLSPSHRSTAAASVLAIVFLVTISVAIVREPRSRLFAGLCLAWIGAVLLGAALHFRPNEGVDVGLRVYYLAAPAFAILASLGLAATARSNSATAWLLVIAWCASLAALQNLENRAWWNASKEIERAIHAISKEAQTIGAGDYGLLMLPGKNDGAYVFENMQGAIVMAASGTSADVNALDRMVAFMPTQIDEWQHLMTQSMVPKYTKRADAPPNPTRFYCKQWGSDELNYLGSWTAESKERWRALWTSAVSQACPSIRVINPM